MRNSPPSLPPQVPDLSALAQDFRASGNPPRCVFVTGPRGAGKTRWIQSRILELVGAQPESRCGVVLAEDGHTRMEHFAHEVPRVAVRRVLLPCPCCPARAYLPDAVRELDRATGAAWIWIETPATAAAGLLREFDRELGWPRQLVLCNDAKWEQLRHRPDLPPFLSAILEQADIIVPPGSSVVPPPAAAVQLNLD